MVGTIGSATTPTAPVPETVECARHGSRAATSRQRGALPLWPSPQGIAVTPATHNQGCGQVHSAAAHARQERSGIAPN